MNSSWDNLSISDKAKLMSIYVKNGITDINFIRNHYNKFEMGGETPKKVDFSESPIVYYDDIRFNMPRPEGPTPRYNVFGDSTVKEARESHRKALQAFIKKNPKIGDIKTSDFYNFFEQLAGLESTYNPLAGKGMKYSGYYGLEGGRDLSVEEQMKKAYEHLAHIFSENMVKEDVAKGVEKGYTPAQILAKYWNQGNRVTEYLYNNRDFKDGVGTRVSNYGFNMTAKVDYNKYLQNAITDDYAIVTSPKTLSYVTKRARVPDMDYTNREKSIANFNRRKNSSGRIVDLNPKTLQVGDTIYLKKLMVK